MQCSNVKASSPVSVAAHAQMLLHPPWSWTLLLRCCPQTDCLLLHPPTCHLLPLYALSTQTRMRCIGREIFIHRDLGNTETNQIQDQLFHVFHVMSFPSVWIWCPGQTIISIPVLIPVYLYIFLFCPPAHKSPSYITDRQGGLLHCTSTSKGCSGSERTSRQTHMMTHTFSTSDK